MSERLVLVVDDDDTIRRLVRIILEADGWRVLEAANGEEALQRLSADAPPFVVLDVMMPGVDGMEVLRRMRAINDEAKIVMLTAKDDPEILTAAEEAGAAAYLTKPFSAEQLQEIVDRLLR